VLVGALWCALLRQHGQDARAHIAPWSAEVDPPNLGMLDAIVRDAIHDDQIPGAVVLVWHNGQVVYRRAFGNRALEPRREPMTVDTIFDVASLTKSSPRRRRDATGAKGEVRLNDPVAEVFSEFAVNGEKRLRFALAEHFSGCVRISI